nr:hypothetical protein [Tanacetum cinerariifolium]
MRYGASRGGGGRGVKEKQHGLANDIIKDTVVVSYVVDKLDSGNIKGKHKRNVGKKPSSSTIDRNIGIVCVGDETWFFELEGVGEGEWNPDVNLLKEDVGSVLVWVKLYGVLVTVFSEDGLSVIATKLGTPMMLDSYTSDMCIQSWGRSSYAISMIELQTDVELKDTIVVAMPKLVMEGDLYVYYSC